MADETDVVEVDETPDVVEVEVGDTGLTAAELSGIYGIDAKYFNQTIDLSLIHISEPTRPY